MKTNDGGTALAASLKESTEQCQFSGSPEACQPSDTVVDAVVCPRNLVVLVVDGNRDSADSLGMVVQLWGHEARVVYNGAGALTSIQTRWPDVVLMDIAMPKIDGYEVARLLRKQCQGSDVLFVVVTGYAEVALNPHWWDQGFSYFLQKPVNLEQLEQILRRAASNKSKMRQSFRSSV